MENSNVKSLRMQPIAMCLCVLTLTYLSVHIHLTRVLFSIYSMPWLKLFSTSISELYLLILFCRLVALLAAPSLDPCPLFSSFFFGCCCSLVGGPASRLPSSLDCSAVSSLLQYLGLLRDGPGGSDLTCFLSSCLFGCVVFVWQCGQLIGQCTGSTSIHFEATFVEDLINWICQYATGFPHDERPGESFEALDGKKTLFPSHCTLCQQRLWPCVGLCPLHHAARVVQVPDVPILRLAPRDHLCRR